MAAVKVGDTVAHPAAPFVAIGKVTAFGGHSGRATATVTWTQDGEEHHQTWLLTALVPVTDPAGARCGLIPGDL